MLRYGLGDEFAVGLADTGPKTLFEKIVERHRVRAGFATADLRFNHEYYTGMCAHLLAQHSGDAYTLHEPASIVCFEDHLSYVERSPVHVAQGLIGGVRRLSTAHRDFVAKHGLKDHGHARDGEGSQGISHAMVAERYALPGQLIVGTDSHTSYSGELGCVAIGVGTTDMANAFMTGAVQLGRPEVLRIEVAGSLPPGTAAKDLALLLLALLEIRAGAGVGRMFEFGGEAIRALGIDERGDAHQHDRRARRAHRARGTRCRNAALLARSTRGRVQARIMDAQ